jgi:Phytanoyl-CoA dioxygenase (PhyH)
MNGWWWDPSAPGRGFFVEYAEAAVRVACCGYGDDGAPRCELVGPIVPDAEGAIVGDSFRLVFRSRDAARLEWRGERIELRHQHCELRERSVWWDGAYSGWWTDGQRVFICEQLDRRIFAALIDGGEWLLLEGARIAGGGFTGEWRRYENGQVAGGPYRAPSGRVVAENASVVRDGEDALLIRLADGTSKRFTLPRVSGGEAARRAPRARTLEVTFSKAHDGKPSSGLLALSLEAEGGPAFRDSAYRLELSSPDGRVPRFEANVRIDGWPRKMAIVLNTHLLPNGHVPFNLRLVSNGQEVWRHSFAVSVANTGPLAEKVRESLLRRKAPLAIIDAVDSSQFDMADPALRPWFDRPDAAAHVDALRASGRIDAREEAALRQFVNDGYLVLDDAIEETLLRRIDGELDDAVAAHVQGYTYGSSQRIRNLHRDYGGVKALWRHPAVMRILELVFEVPARPCQTLTYVFGSQQEPHQDTVHLTPFPAGYMCGVWVALEDVKPDSGELEVFPGTHRLPRLYMNGSGCDKVTDDDWGDFGRKIVARYQRMLEEGGFSKVTYRPKRGTVLVWHENLLHGGSVRRDTSLSRRSIVSHYFGDGAIAFYDSTGLPGYMD